MPNFYPFDNTSKVISVTTTSAATALGDPGTDIRLINVGAEGVFCALGDSTVVATAGDGGGFYLPPSSNPEPFRFKDATHIAMITSSGTATVYLTVGDGE